jgi:predicted enzyme related to lactoylglutathione lyase
MTVTLSFAFNLEYVSDIESAKRFYVEVFGLQIEREAPTFVQFKDQAGVRYAIASDEAMSEGRGPELYWRVDNAEAALKALSQHAEVCLPLKEMAFGKVFGIKGPSGHPQYLIEFAQNRPSQAV